MIVRVRSAAVASIGNSFDVGKVLLVDMGMFPPTAAYHGFVSIIQVQCSNISSATTATLMQAHGRLQSRSQGMQQSGAQRHNESTRPSGVRALVLCL